MEEERKLIVGIDLGEHVTQMSCFDFNIFEPVSIGRMMNGERIYEFPTALAIDEKRGEWFFTDEIPENSSDLIFLHYLLADVIREDVIRVGDFSVDSYVALKRFIVKVLSVLSEYYPKDKIRKLVITLSEKTEKMISYFHRLAEELHLPQGVMVVQNHRQSYMYYAVSQPKELWVNNVGLFEMERGKLNYLQINIDKKSIPYIIGVTKKELSEGLDWEELEQQGNEKIAYAFLNTANTVLHKQYVTTLYVTGKGFEKEWVGDALKKLCSGRRVFSGQNLFTRGACYAARELSGSGKLTDCLFLDEEMISSNVSLRLYTDACMKDVLVAKAGSVWSDVDTSVDVIPDDEEEIQITIQNILKHETRAHMLSLSGFSGRANKMTRFTIRIRFADSKTCIVTLKDNGFGEFCPSSNRVWERHITIG